MGTPLSGVRILDFTRVLSGPYASMCLADLGADVVKVEHPKRGDDTRAFGPPFSQGVSTYFLSINRGKRSIALDLKSPEGIEQARRLAGVADVVVENFRPGVMKRLGLGPDELCAAHPRLIYCSISGFGQGSPGRAGYDLMVQGLSGIPSITGEPSSAPAKCGASIGDLVAGLNAVQGILAALVRREQTGEGGMVDVSMLQGLQSLLTYHASAWLNGGARPGRIGNAHPSIHPFCSYKTSDGYLNLCVGNDALWVSLCEVLGEEGLSTDARFSRNPDRVEHRHELDAVLGPIFSGRSTDAWLEALDEAGIPAGPVLDVPTALAEQPTVTHAHPEGAGMVQTLPHPVAFEGQALAAERRAPRLGEHTEEVLAAWLGVQEC